MILRFAMMLLVLCCAAGAPEPGPVRQVLLVPATSVVAIRTYGLGLLPFDGQFARFQGVLRYGDGGHASCSVALRVDVASLAMGSPTMTATMLGPDLLDAARYPQLVYDGACATDGLAGELTMHGVTRPLELSVDWGGSMLTAMGKLRRTDWGMDGLPLVGGSTVRIKVTVGLAVHR
ncbi:MAG TPA: YceI family protein [Acetobacteraceae bacterium]|nr:YceI family protein [Acetobacteraceae bacterium]